MAERTFSKRSLRRLRTCHPDLQRLFIEVVKHFDCTVLEGHRNKRNQNEAHRTGRSKLKWPKGKHNKMPSLAVDVAPYPVNWKDLDRFYLFAGFVKGVASQMGIKLRLGADWDGDTEVMDQTFHDLPHFELLTK